MGNFSYQDLERLSREMASLARANIPLPEGLRQMAKSFAPGRVRLLYDALSRSLDRGQSLSEAMRQQAAPPAYVAAIRCAETAGDMTSVLGFSVEHCRRMNRHLTSVRTALLYPFLAIAVVVGVLLLLSHTALPKMINVFAELGASMPPLSVAVFQLSHFLRSPAGTALAILLMIALLTLPFLRSTENLIPGLVGRLPFFHALINLSDMALLMRFLAAMTERGVPLPASLRAAGLSAWTPQMRRALNDMAQAAERGQRVGPLLAQVAPPVAAYLFQQAEERGELSDACHGIADYLEDRFESFHQAICQILEPILIVFLGLVVGTIVSALYMPLFDLPKHIR